MSKSPTTPKGPKGPLTQQEALAYLITATAELLHQAVPIDPQTLLGLVQHEVQSQQGYEQVIHDLADPAARQAHPYWGFFISGVHPKTKETVEIARTHVPKVLDPSVPDYLAQLAAWTNTYMLAITPAARAAWRGCGFTVNFFQSAQTTPAPTDNKPKLALVK